MAVTVGGILVRVNEKMSTTFYIYIEVILRSYLNSSYGMQASEMRRRIYVAAGGRLGTAFLDSLSEADLKRLAARHGVHEAPVPAPAPVVPIPVHALAPVPATASGAVKKQPTKKKVEAPQ
jgi:hypothetical protein